MTSHIPETSVVFIDVSVIQKTLDQLLKIPSTQGHVLQRSLFR